MSSYDEVLQIVMLTAKPFLSSDIELTPETPLVDKLDSASAVNILLALESRLGITLGAGDLSFDHLKTCQTLAKQFATRTGK